ncbi:alpha/beta hydrolase fold domain-containing protein, partial [Kitasatospora sp. NPDC059463]|uniref:alpha/beta hydrolase fold domain-containing protein n=1 Tax=Kitasatospora sp. NPDC059463 TaxID=3346842 RepID=UPI003683C981
MAAAGRRALRGRRAGREGVRLVSGRPAGSDGPLPLLYHLHGGGLVGGHAWSVLPLLLRELAGPPDIAVVSVAYRPAPAAPYPAAVEDCLAGLRWTAGHAERLGIDAGRVVVGGKGAGGGLAAALALLVRDRGGAGAGGRGLLCPCLELPKYSLSAPAVGGAA